MLRDIIKQLVHWTSYLLYPFALALKRKPVILLMDRVNSADDNAEAMYRYLKSKTQYNVYYILERKSKDWDRIQPDNHIVSIRSFRYLWLYLQADVFLFSYSRFMPGDIQLYTNRTCKMVWLQHGVIHEDLSKVYNVSKGHDLITLATRAEYEDRLRKEYGYNTSQLLLSGLARYDLLENNTKKIITIGLTWRRYLNNSGNDDFKKSSFFIIWEDLIFSNELLNIAKRYGFNIQFLFHPEINQNIRRCVMERKSADIALVENKSYVKILSESALLITDYSSLAFDMAYLNKPIVYYQKDVEEFFSGKHTYTKGYFDFERDGFGEVAYNKEDLLKFVEQYLESECQMRDIYSERARNTFEYHDRNNRERIWTEVESRFLNR